MTGNDESPATPPERKAFHSTILDLAIADKTQVELFGAVGRTKGPFTGVIDWPYLNGLIEDQSRNILTNQGEEAWRAAGGTYGADSKPTFARRSISAAQIVQGVANGPGGFIWTDTHGTGWAVSLVSLHDPNAYAGLAISWNGGGRVIDPLAREEYRRAVEQQMAELGAGGEAETRPQAAGPGRPHVAVRARGTGPLGHPRSRPDATQFNHFVAGCGACGNHLGRQPIRLAG